MGQKVIQRHPETGGVHKVTAKQAAQVYEPLGWETTGDAADVYPEDLRLADEVDQALIAPPVDVKAIEAEQAMAEAVQAGDAEPDKPKKTTSKKEQANG